MIIYQFPYKQVKKGDNVVLYGAGEIGRSLTEQACLNEFVNVVAIVDKNYKEINNIKGKTVMSPEMIPSFSFDKLIVAARKKNEREEMVENALSMNVKEERIVACDYPGFDTATPIETAVIRTVFNLLGIEKPSYIDVGACHPHLANTTMKFYEEGSRGINIEPNVYLKDEFYMFRPQDINLFIGIANYPGYMTLYMYDDEYLNTFGKYRVEQNKIIYNQSNIFAEMVVEVTTLNDVVEKYYNGKFPDFLDIDIEGLEEEVLRDVDFEQSSPKLICVEGSVQKFNPILINKKCEGDGYMPYCRINHNSIYLRKDVYGKILSI